MPDVLSHPICFDEPERFTAVAAWHGHIPVAFYLVSALRPRLIVELGVHAGDSYCAFCQAVARLELDTECHGIDHWKGDEHAGFYGDDVLNDLRAHHDERYGHFSTLHRATFDEAVERFDDGSIDLLHIDGLHTYEAVKHDFDTWWPKVREGGVVLLHDTEERSGDWGVYRLWQDLERDHAAFGFTHGHGLGLVLKGDPHGHPLEAWWKAEGDEEAGLRSLFAALGDRFEARDRTRIEQAGLRKQVADLREHHDDAVRQGDDIAADRDRVRAHADRIAAESEALQAELGATKERARWHQEDARKAHEALQATLGQLAAIQQSRAWRLARGLRALAPGGSRRHRWLTRARRAAAIARHEGPGALYRRLRDRIGTDGHAEASYEAWIAANERNTSELDEQRTVQAAWSHRPLVSVLTPVWNCPPELLRRTIASVQAQTYDHWELCLVDGASDDDAVRTVIEEEAGRDSRIRFRFLDRNQGISGNSNVALDMAEGEFVAPLDHDDLLAPDALYEVVQALQERADRDVVYFDEDKVAAAGGERSDPWFKPDWSPALLLSVNYLMHSVVRRSLVDEAGGFDPATDGGQDWDLLLRVTERTDRIHHVPKVLYHWRKSPGSAAAEPHAKPWANRRHAGILRAHLERRGVKGVDIQRDAMGRHRVRFRHDRPKASIIIATKDCPEVLGPCLDSLFSRTLYRDFEIVLVDTGTTDPQALAIIDRWQQQEDRFRVVHDGRPFNFSAANNLGAEHAGGDVLVFLNNDIEVQEPDWLDELVQWTQRPEIGCVGAKLVYPDGRIQHAGIIMGMHGHASHVFMGHHDIDGGPFGSVNWYRNYLAVTGACIAVRRDVFDKVGGFDEDYRLIFSDVQLGLDVHKAGYRNLYTPYCCLIHHEGATRGAGMPAEDIWLGYERFKDIVAAGDPYYNSNLNYGEVVPTVDPDPAPRLERLHRVSMEYPIAAQRGRGGGA